MLCRVKPSKKRGLTENDDSRDESDTETSDKTTNDNNSETVGSEHLHDNTSEVLWTSRSCRVSDLCEIDGKKGARDVERGGEKKSKTHDTTTSNNSGTTTHHIGKVTSDEGSEEGTGGQDRNDEGGVGRADSIGISSDRTNELLG